MARSVLSSVSIVLGVAGLTIFLVLNMTTVDAKGRSPYTKMSYDGGKTFCQGPNATCHSDFDCCPVLEEGETGNYTCVDDYCCLKANKACYYDGECCGKMVCGEFQTDSGLGTCREPKRFQRK